VRDNSKGNNCNDNKRRKAAASMLIKRGNNRQGAATAAAVQALMAKANDLKLRCRERQAIRLYKSAFALDPKLQEACLGISDCYRRLNDRRRTVFYLKKLRILGKLPEHLYVNISDWFVDQCEFSSAIAWLKDGMYHYAPNMELLRTIQHTIAQWDHFKKARLIALKEYSGAKRDLEFINFIVAHGSADEYLKQNPEIIKAGIGAYAHWFGCGFLQGRAFPGIVYETITHRDHGDVWRYFRFKGVGLRARRSESSNRPWTMEFNAPATDGQQELPNHWRKEVSETDINLTISPGELTGRVIGGSLSLSQIDRSEPNSNIHAAEQKAPIGRSLAQRVLLENTKPTADGVLTVNPQWRDLRNDQWTKLADKSTRELRVAAVMDEFTFASYAPECMLQQLTPSSWKKELEDFQPELLFIESAWRGKDDLWRGKIGHLSSELRGVIEWCRSRKIPTVFWNKEDPVHFETFLNTASLFDFVFTTDIDCIHRYKYALCHNNIYLLPFACQPAVHNPVEAYKRKDAFCFAGAYYVRYPERIRDLDSFLSNLPEFRSVEIYDRNLGKDNPDYQFPPRYIPYIVGTLPVEKINKAYKGYSFAINMNSVKQSQSMFARRIFELLASNTFTVSNYSRGLRIFVGDLVVATDSGERAVSKLNRISQDKSQMDRIRLAGVRKTLLDHTYGVRLSYLVSKVSSKLVHRRLYKFVVVGRVESREDAEALLSNFSRQRGVNATITLVTSTTLPSEGLEAFNDALRVVREDDIRHMSLFELAGGDVDWIAAMTTKDYYGPHYLLDIALATEYVDTSVIGKAAHHVLSARRVSHRRPKSSYRRAKRLLARRSAISSTAARDILAREWISNLEKWEYLTPDQFAIDPFNYCEGGGHRDCERIVSTAVDDLPLDTGLPLNQILYQAESVEPSRGSYDGKGPILVASSLAELFRGSSGSGVDTRLENEGLRLQSSLRHGEHSYFYASINITRAELRLSEVEESVLRCHLVITPGLDVRLVVRFLDNADRAIGHEILAANRNHAVKLPSEAAGIKLGLRVFSNGTAHIQKLCFGHISMDPMAIFGKAEHLVLTNNYPSYHDIYRNGFVHSRVIGYKEKGINVDVFQFKPGAPVSYHEFEGIDVVTGSQEALRRMLASGNYRSVLVHFLDASMWEILRSFESLKVIVWVHGAEIQHWQRRAFDFATFTREQVNRYKTLSNERMKFWSRLLTSPPPNLSFVFVSRYFADEVAQDLGIQLPEGQHCIIHNPVDVDFFAFQEKQASQRTRILSIRPFASRKYANDLTVRAILDLSKQSFFRELSFRIIGDGSLFEETLAPLRGFENVMIERRFLSRDQICALHREYGVFLCPTRMDSQGVSRDEAMASGLVPITNAVSAIPEFVDGTCGILAPAEDFNGLATGIMNLYHEPLLFSHLSSAAAARVRRQSASGLVTTRELSLFEPTEVESRS
jgi:spore maturation protein CgeB/glycosyltransferase involved in cell wall biosynthesis